MQAEMQAAAHTCGKPLIPQEQDTLFTPCEDVRLGERQYPIRAFSCEDGVTLELLCLSDTLLAAGRQAGTLGSLKTKLRNRLRVGMADVNDCVLKRKHVGMKLCVSIGRAQFAASLLECSVADCEEGPEKEEALALAVLLRQRAAAQVGVSSNSPSRYKI